MPELVVAYLDGTEERHPLRGQELLIGRDTVLAVSIPDSKISRRHARLFLKRGQWYVEDLGSVNGVIVHGIRIEGPVLCAVGTPFAIGDATLTLVPTETAPAAAPTPRVRSQETGWSLRAVGGPLSGIEVALKGTGALFVGREAKNDVVLADASLSRQHARIQVGAQELEVQDLGSSNGTYVNDKPVQQVRVRPGQKIRFGNVVVMVQREGHMATPEAAAAATPEPRRVRAPLMRRVLAGLAVLAVVGGTSYSLLRDDAPHKKPKAQNHPPAQAPKPTDDEAPAAPEGDTSAQAPKDEAPEVTKAGAEAKPAPTAPSTHSTSPADAAPRPAAAAKAGPDLAVHGVRARLTRAWHRALGEGPTPAEVARARTLDALYAKAVADSHRGDLEGALGTARELLRQDALHVRGRQLMVQLLVEQRERTALKEAQLAMQAGHALEALSTVSGATDLPQGFAQGPMATELADVGHQATLMLGQACGERAQAACMAQAWQACIGQLSCLLGYQPQATQGVALLTLAYDAVMTAGTAIPEASGGTGDESEPLTRARAARDAYAMAFPQPALRQAVLIYSSGDIGAAAQKLHPLTCGQCRMVGKDVRTVALGLPRAKQLRDGGQPDAALAAYDAVLQADGRLCPTPAASVLRDLAQDGKLSTLLLIGDAAYERGSYTEALTAYKQAQDIGRPSAGLAQALARLRHRADEIYAALKLGDTPKKASNKLTRKACERLTDIVTMTLDQDDLHQRAAAWAALCEPR